MQNELARGLFLDSLYAAAVGAISWHAVLQNYASLVDAPVGAINLHYPEQATSHHAAALNTSESFMSRNRQYWLAREPWILKGYEKVRIDPGHARNGFVFHGSAEVPTGELLESEWYRDFGRELELQDCLALTAKASGGHFITLSANTGGKGTRVFKSEAVQLAQSLKADFCRALLLHVELTRQKTRNTITDSWQSANLPVLVLRSSDVLQANDAARSAMEAGDIISASPAGKVRLADPTLADLAKALQRSCDEQHASMIATGRSGSRWLAQLVRFNQLSGSLLGAAGAEDPAVMLTLTPLDQDAAGRKQALQSLTMLTPTEKQVAWHFLNGDSIEATARTRRQSAETIRWHVRNMIAKTGARNLADLCRILALLLPV